jgi:O-antigen/teichoic acid export membrane protein
MTRYWRSWKITAFSFVNRIPDLLSGRWFAGDNNRALQFFNISRFSANFLSGWVLVKAGLPIAEISVYEALLFLGNLFTFFWHSGGQNALISFYPKITSEQRSRLLFNAFFLFCCLSLVSAGCLWWSRDFIAGHFRQFESLPYMGWLCVYVALNVPAYLLHIFFLLDNEPERIVRYAFWSFGAQFLVVIAPVLSGWGLRPVFAGLALLAALRFAYTLMVLRRKNTFVVDPVLLRVWGLMTIPLSLHVLAGSGMEYVDGWIVNNYFSDPGAFAVFRYGARELPLIPLVLGALITSSIPLIAADREGGPARLKEQTLALARWMYPLGIALLFLSPVLFPLVYDEQFVTSAWLFNIYLLILACRFLLPQVILIGLGERYILVISAVLETMLNIGLSLWWVRLYGLWGIAAATVAANAFNKFNLILYCRFKLKIAPQAYIPWRPLLLLNLALGLSFYLSYLVFWTRTI